jgi:hypothetical protein
MTLLTNLGNYAAVTILGVLLLHYLNGRFDRIDRQFEKFGLKLDEKASKTDVDRLAGEVAIMRSDRRKSRSRSGRGNVPR